MELFAAPLACSLASHITAVEAGLPVKVRFVENKKTDDGGDYYAISAKGYVPALRLEDGRVLNEGPSVLQYLADRKPDAGLAPAWGTIERYELIDTLNYLSTEVHKRIFAKRRTALLRYGDPEEVAHGTLNFCLPASRYMTGAVLPVDGGLTIRNA